MKIKSAAYFIFLFSTFHFNFDTLKVEGIIYHGELIPSKILPTILITASRPFADRTQQIMFANLKNDVATVYPYAKQTAALLVEINQHLETLHSKKEKRNYIKQKEDAVNQQFKNKLVNMTTRQGRILILLINRETGTTCYELVKEFKGGLKSWIYNTMMTTYDDDLDMKRKYVASEQFMIERAIFEIENTTKIK
jgi:Domain of unknown function (DUF4294)